MAWPPPTVTSALGPLTLTLTLTLTFVLHTRATPPRPRATDVRRHHPGYSKFPPGGSSRGGSSASRDEFLRSRLSAFRRSVLEGFGRVYEQRLPQSPPPTSDSPSSPCSWQNPDDVQRMLSGLFLSENDLRTMLQPQTQGARESSQGQTSAAPSQKRVLVLPEGEELRRGATQPQSRHGQEPAFFSKADSTGSRVRDRHPQLSDSDRQHPSYCQTCMTEIGYEVLEHIVDFKGHNHTVINFKNAYQFIPSGRCVNEHSPCGRPGWRCRQVTRAQWTLVWTPGTGVNLVPHEVPSHCQCLNLGHAPSPGSAQSGAALLDHASLSHASYGQDQASRDHAPLGRPPLDHASLNHAPRGQDHAPRDHAPRDHAPLGHASVSHAPRDHAPLGPAPNHRLQRPAARGSGRGGVRRGMGWAGLNVGHRNSTAAPLRSPHQSDCLFNTRDCPPLAASTTSLHPFAPGSSPDSYRLSGPPSPSSSEPVTLDPYLSSPGPYPVRVDLTHDGAGADSIPAGSDSLPMGSDSNFENHDLSSSVNPDPYSANPDPYSVNPDSYSSNPDPYATKPDPSSAKPHGPSSVNSDPYHSRSSPFSVSWQQLDPATSSVFPAWRQPRPGSGTGTEWDGHPSSANPDPVLPLAASSSRSSLSTAVAAAEDDLALAVDATGSVTGGSVETPPPAAAAEEWDDARVTVS